MTSLGSLSLKSASSTATKLANRAFTHEITAIEPTKPTKPTTEPTDLLILESFNLIEIPRYNFN